MSLQKYRCRRERERSEDPSAFKEEWMSSPTVAIVIPFICAIVYICVGAPPPDNEDKMLSKKTNKTPKKSTKKKTGRTKARPVSASYSEPEMYCPVHGSRRRMGNQYRPMSASHYMESFLQNERLQALVTATLTTNSSRQLKVQPAFPFHKLPTDCKLKVFSFLGVMDRGRAAGVCVEWNELMKSASLWTHVDLTKFPLCPIQKSSHICGKMCYTAYRTRVKGHMTFLQSLNPPIRYLSFALDIGDYEDCWLNSLEELLKNSRCKDLEVAQLNWKDTPVRPFWIDQMGFSSETCKDAVYHHRRRQRTFVGFFDTFTTLAPNVRKLVLPFDWSHRSISYLSKLTKLETLVLERYYVLQTLSQAALDQLLTCVPHLKRLILQVWSPSGKGLQMYHLKSDSLVDLDISQCRGFYLGSVELAALEVFHVKRQPWNGPLVCRDSLNLPCIYDVLSKGAPKLKFLNNHELQRDWRENLYPELEAVLRQECSCRRHKSGWLM